MRQNSARNQARHAYGRDIRVPSEHITAHDYCLRLHDHIARLVNHGYAHDLFKLRMRLTEEEGRECQEPGWHPWDWLEKTKRPAELGELLIKSLFPALATDFC